MIKNRKNIKGKTIREWEEAIKGREDIEFENFRLLRGAVVVAGGFAIANGKSYPIVWKENGFAYHSKARIKRYDIIFKEEQCV